MEENSYGEWASTEQELSHQKRHFNKNQSPPNFHSIFPGQSAHPRLSNDSDWSTGISWGLWLADNLPSLTSSSEQLWGYLWFCCQAADLCTTNPSQPMNSNIKMDTILVLRITPGFFFLLSCFISLYQAPLPSFINWCNKHSFTANPWCLNFSGDSVLVFSSL